MSGYFGDSIWIGDLDGYISIDAIDWSNRLEQEERERDLEFSRIGDIALLSGKFVQSHLMQDRKIEPSEWRWAVHQAEITLCASASGQELERDLIRALINLGRGYAVARYAKWEKVPHPSALTAMLPFGFRALLSQYLAGQGLLGVRDCRERVRAALGVASQTDGKVAYQRAGIVQALIHDLAADALGRSGRSCLHRDAARVMLSLARLHYSVEELRLDGFAAAANLSGTYAQVREKFVSDDAGGQCHSGRHIPNWRMRHLRPLTDLFPYSIRGVIDRGVSHVASGEEIKRDIAINELAIAHSGVLLMRKRSYGGVRK